ncbi:hypothetical protein TorRG33x02_326050, partial [Trema orientale]
RDISDRDLGSLMELLGCLSGASISPTLEDRRQWLPDESKGFFSKSCLISLSEKDDQHVFVPHNLV